MDARPEQLLAYNTVEAIGFAAGAELCLMLAFLQWRSAHRAMIWLWIAGFVWSGGSFVRYMLLLGGVPAEAPSAKIALTLAWSVSAFGPTPMVQAAMRHMPRPVARFEALAVGVSFLAGCVILGLYVLAALLPEPPISMTSATKAAFFIALPQMLLYGYSHLGPHRWAGRKTAGAGGRITGFVKAAAVIMGVWIVATLTSILSPFDSLLAHAVLGLISEMWVIPLAILAAIALAKTHYADVILKRSLGLLVSIVVATLLVWRVPDLPRGIPVVALSLLGAALMVTAPLLYRTLGKAVDKLILKKPDYRSLAKAYGDAARKTPDLDALRTLTEDQLSSALGLTAKISSPNAAEDAERRPFGDGQLELSPRRQAKALMQAEMNFIEDVAAEFTRREEALAFEAERMEREQREARLKHAVTEARLEALRAQVDPHFLFNTLNAITDLIATDPDKAETMTERLAAFFRYTLNRQEQTVATLDEELDFVRQYLDIEKVRFGDRLKVEIKKDKGLGEESVPSLILQPLVENALRHGLSSRLEGGKISVTAEREGKALRLEVADDGVGFTDKSRDRVGLKNVRERLKALHGEAASMTIGKGLGGKGSSIVLCLPA